MSKKQSQQSAVVQSLKGAFRKLSEGLKALTPTQLGVNADYVQNLVVELENAYKKLDAGEALTLESDEGYESLHDDNATMKAELQEANEIIENLKTQVLEAEAVLNALNLLKEITANIETKIDNLKS